MPRMARKISGTGIYHIVLRGMDRRTIFYDDEDCERFMETLEKVRGQSGLQLYAWCLMGNHVHLLLKEGTENLALVFKRIGASYVYYYNRKYELCGHLFQDRFRSEPIEEDPYFLDVLRYICQNPVKAGLSKEPFRYPWLGCSGIEGKYPTDSMDQLTDLTGQQLIEFLSTPIEAAVPDFTQMKRISDREAARRICSTCQVSSPLEIGNWPPERKSEAVRLIQQAGLSIRQISRSTGISKAIVERILREWAGQKNRPCVL